MHLGIDFGTSYTKLGYISNGSFINLVANGQVPSVVVYLPQQEKLYFGPMALRLNEPGAMQARFFKLELKRNPEFMLGKYTLEDILREYFLYLRREYVDPCAKRIESVTVSVPNYFGLRPRNILINAIRQSFNVDEVYLLPEPVAALLGYNLKKPANYLEGEILCIDIGGGTTDFSFINLSRSRKEIVMESQFQIGHDAFSGSELDRGILRLILNPLLKMQHGCELPSSVINLKNLKGRERFWHNNLMAIAEDVKIRMSRQNTAYFNIPGFYQENSLVFSLSAELFMAQLDSVFSRLKNYIIQHVWERARYLGLYQEEGRFSLDYLLLLGGASQTRGVKTLISDLFKGPEIICPTDVSFNVVRGLCLWHQELVRSLVNVKSIYPFNFYIEKRGINTDTDLYKIPFDTDNLELDINSRYKIFSVPLDSPYNLADHPGQLKLRIYELAQGDSQANVEHFMGQDLVLRFDHPEMNTNMVDLYLNLGTSRIEVGDANSTNLVGDKIPPLHSFAHQEAVLDYLRLYPDTNPQLLQDYAAYLQQYYDPMANQEQEYSTLLMYKLLALLQLL